MLFKNKIAFTAMAFTGATCLALAQPPGGGFPGGGLGGMMMMQGRGGSDPTQLLNNKSVLDELKLSEDDAKEILQKYSEETSGLLAKILADSGKGDQAKRLNQIRTQQLGLRAFSDAKIASLLKLSDDQKKEIKELEEDVRKEADEMRKEIGMDFSKMGEMMKKVGELNKQALGKATELLKDNQKATWQELVGKPFEMKMGGGRGGPGGPGGGRNRRTD
ncbi:MAG: hypothetical protein LW700_03240 [Gemmataceae bacterium]|jgi:hypothetical protein|nr:hypothetical protein [Gemmataceae bacterium]